MFTDKIQTRKILENQIKTCQKQIGPVGFIKHISYPEGKLKRKKNTSGHYNQEAKAFENPPWQCNFGDSHMPRAVHRETVSPETLRNPSLQL